MTQIGIVMQILPDNMALVSVERGSACGGNCASCGGCSYKSTLTAKAENAVSAKVGDRVTLQSQTTGIIRAAAFVYLLPVLTFLAGYMISAAFGAAEGVSIAVSVISLLLGCGLVSWFGKRRKSSITFEIISIER